MFAQSTERTSIQNQLEMSLVLLIAANLLGEEAVARKNPVRFLFRTTPFRIFT